MGHTCHPLGDEPTKMRNDCRVSDLELEVSGLGGILLHLSGWKRNSITDHSGFYS